MLGIGSYRTAWFMAMRIRETMTDDGASPLGGEGKVVEADETYYGKSNTAQRLPNTNKPSRSKQQPRKDKRMSRPVIALVERGGKVRAMHVGNATKDIVAKMPIQGMLPKDVNLDDRELTKVKAMIDSMTEAERLNPKLFNDSRVRRIARGSGRPPKDVNELLKKFTAMRQMMGMLGKNMGGMLGKIPGMGALGQLNNMRKAAQMAGPAGGGMGEMANMFADDAENVLAPAHIKEIQRRVKPK